VGSGSVLYFIGGVHSYRGKIDRAIVRLCAAIKKAFFDLNGVADVADCYSLSQEQSHSSPLSKLFLNTNNPIVLCLIKVFKTGAVSQLKSYTHCIAL
jgi:hypothetical protein